MKTGYHKVMIGGKLHVMTTENYKIHKKQCNDLAKSIENNVSVREKFCEQRQDWYVVDKEGNFIDH